MRMDVVVAGCFASGALLGCPEWHTAGGAAERIDAGVRLDAVAMADVQLPDPGVSATTTYIVDDYVIPDAPTGPRMDTAPGFNLDDRISVEGGAGECEDFIGDYVSPRGEGGVDNQLVGVVISTLMGFIADLRFEEAVETGITSGRRILAIRVSGIDSYSDDPSVTVDWFYVKPASCTGDVCELPGGVRPDASWIARGAPLETGAPGRIVGGRLSTTMTAFPLVLGDSVIALDLQIEDAVLEARVTPTALSEATLGGGITIDDYVAAFEALMPGIGETARGLLEMYADIQPDPRDPVICQSLSAGISLSAVRGDVSGP